jgi:hypothetical protein
MVLRLVTVFAMAAALAQAQQPIGAVGVQDATVSGPLVVNNGLAMLEGGTTVTAKDQTATVKLTRGGEVRVCATSSLHVTAGKSAAGPEPLLLTLGRGAMEVQMPVTESDAIMTPDLRFAMKARGPLDLRLRVTNNGDTCVENRGADAPALRITDPFGGAIYILLGGQHVLFEHASLKEVVDNESSPCGCPPPPVVSVADAGATSTTPATPGSAVASNAAAEQHPFPAAVSDGLATPTVPQAAPGVVHVQVATALHYDAADTAGTAPGTAAVTSATAASAAVAPAIAQAPPPPPAPPARDVAHSIGHFFKRLFRRR